MRRKSERTTTKKAKASPEKKIEKSKRIRTRRRKQSSSSENESPDECSAIPIAESVAELEKTASQTPAQEDISEDAQDQVWRVKAPEGSGDGGEIQKLKICLTRPPSTPERIDQSPHSKRKQSRALSSSDTPSVESVEDKKRTKHRKRSIRDKDDSEKNDSHSEDHDMETERQNEDEQQNPTNEAIVNESSPHTLMENNESPMPSSKDEVKENDKDEVVESSQKEQESTDDIESHGKGGDVDTTAHYPEEEARNTALVENVTTPKFEGEIVQSKSPPESSFKEDEHSNNHERERSVSVEKSEVLELYADDSKCESSDTEASQSKNEDSQDAKSSQDEAVKMQSSVESKVSKTEESVHKKTKTIDTDSVKATNEHDVVESSDISSKEIYDKASPANSSVYTVYKKQKPTATSELEIQGNHQLKHSDSVQSTLEPIVNGQPTLSANKKRRWGARPSKITSQKSITISTDVLKDIIPDVKPVEFQEIAEERKHRREREVKEKVYRPILPKIVIDNTEHVEQKKEIIEELESKPRDLASIRKISIINDNDSIIAKPLSPSRNEQSCILYITNLVRPFTLTQLKNLLQRTGRIADNGFWIDKIKSKCFVQYENDEQAVETRHALHGVTWPVSNPKTLQVDFSTEEAFEKAKINEESDVALTVTKPGTVEDWLQEQDMKRERGESEKPWEKKAATREWDVGKNDKDKDKEKLRLDEKPTDKRRRRSPEKSPEPARKFKKKEEEAPAKLLDDLFRKTKTTPCIYWLPLSAETIAIKEQQRRQHMADHERRLQEMRRTHRRH